MVSAEVEMRPHYANFRAYS